MATKIQVRRDTAANWTSANTVLSAGEMGWESDTGYMKIGDGTTAWSSLSYFTPSGADANTTYTVGVAQNAANADITLDGSDASTDTLSLVAGSNLTLAVAGDNITVNALDSQYAITTETGGIIRLTASGNATGTDDITIAGGTGISVADGSDTLTVNLDAAFNDLSNVNAPSPGSYDHLQWDGSNWVNEAVYFYSTKRFSGGLATDRFIELQNRVITIGSISSGDVVDFPTNFSGGSNYGIEWQVNNPETDFVANLTPGPVNINTSTYFRVIIDNTNSALTDKGYISGLQRNGVTQTVNWTNTIDGTAPNVSGADVYDIYEFYCFRGNGGSDETWYGTLLTGASGTMSSLSDVDVLANSGNPTPVNGSFLQYDSTDTKWNASTRFERSINFQQGGSASRLGFQEVIYWDETKYTGSNGDTLTLDLDTDHSNRVGNSGRFFIETIDHNFVADFQNAVHPEELAQVTETIGLHNKFMIVVDNNVRNETRLDTVYAPSGVALGETIIINGTTVTQTSDAISAGPHGFSDLITAAGISGVSAWYHREGNYRILSETVGSTETGLQIGAGTANATLGISEGNYGSEEYGSPGVGLIGVKINGRTVRTVWSSGSVPVAKAGRYEVYEIDYFPDSGHGNPNEYVFVRHHNTDSLDGDLDLNNQNITGTGNINILGNYQIEKAVSGTGETFGSILAKTATTEYNKIDFKTGPDAFADNGEVTWSTRVQGALTQIFEIKGSSVGKSGIAVNPNSNAEVDFLVSGASDATLFVVDAGDDNVGIGKYPTQGKLDVDGDVYATTYYGDGSNLTGISGGGGGLSDVVDDTTPQLGGSLDVNGQDIVSVSNGNITLTPNGAGVVRIDGTNGIDMESGAISIKNAGAESYVRFYCEVSNAHYTQLQAAPHADYSGNVTVTLPATATRLVGRSTTDTLTNKTFADKPTFESGVIEGFSDLTGATGVVAHDTTNGHIFRHTSIAADFTANFTNLGLTNDHGTMVSLMLVQGGTAYIPTAVQIGGAAQTILWQGGSPPSGTSSGTDIVSFSITQSGGSYTVLGQLTSYS